eukprot:gene15697-21238_t
MILAETQQYYNVLRDEAKTLFIILAYYGSFNNWEANTNKPPTQFIQNYICELQFIGSKIIDANPNLQRIVKSLEKSNEKGTVVSLFLQDKERQVLELMYNSLSSIHPNIKTNAVLCFDGIMIPFECFQPELLQELHQEILLKTGFDLLFTTKAFDKHLLDQLGPENVVLNPDSFEVVAEEFEQTHCKIILKEGIYIKSDGQNITFYSKQSLRDAYEHLAYDNSKTFINKWTIGNNSIRAYDNMDYYPALLETPPNIFNLWTVFKAEKYTASYETHRIGLELFLNHIYIIICGNQKNVADYVIKWMAQMIQYPAVKTRCLTLISKQGAGKGTLMKLLEKILGIQKILETTNPNRDVRMGRVNSMVKCQVPF